MTEPRRLDADLPVLLRDIYPFITPSYRDDIVGRTARSRQRPAWTFPERWLPVTLTLRRPVLAAPTWLALGLLLLVALLAAVALVPVLSRPTTLFSIATTPWGNGLIAFDESGDISVVDPSSGDPRVLIGGPASDSKPDWSPDGTRIAFWRNLPLPEPARLMVANADGSDPIRVTPDSVTETQVYRWSPDGTRLAIAREVDGHGVVSIVNADGSGMQDLDLGISADFPAWHPSGESILFRGVTDAGVPGFYTIDLASGAVTGPVLTVDATTPLFERWGWTEYLWEPLYSPDGSAILYSTVVELSPGRDPSEQQARVRIVDADGTNDHEIAFAPDSRYEMAGGWSPDASRVAIHVEQAGPIAAPPNRYLSSVAILSVSDESVTVATEPELDGFQSIWAPDGSSMLTWGGSPIHSALVDTRTGATTPMPWDIRGSADWQPVAR